MSRLSPPIKIAIVLVLSVLAIVLAISVRVILDELPPHTQETIVQRFGEEIEVVATVAEDFPLDLCSEMEADGLLAKMDEIRAFYGDMKGHHPSLQGPIRLRAEEDNVWPPGSRASTDRVPEQSSEEAGEKASAGTSRVGAPTKAAS